MAEAPAACVYILIYIVSFFHSVTKFEKDNDIRYIGGAMQC